MSVSASTTTVRKHKGNKTMSEFVKRQEETKANLVSQIRSIIDHAETEGRGLDAAESEQIERIESDIDSAVRAIEVAQRNHTRMAEAEEAARDFVQVEEARGDADIFRSLATGEMRSHTFNPETRATLVPSDNTVRKGFLDEVFFLARQVGPMLDEANVIQRASGESLRLPTLTAYSTAAQYAAGSAISDDEPTFSSINLTPWKQAFIVKIASELATDSSLNIESVIREQAANAIGYQVNSLATIGTGTVQPTGIVTAASSAVAAGTTSFTADNLIDLAYSLDGAARRMGPKWMCNTATLGAIRKLKDDNNQYIYNPVVGGPDTLLGFPVVENPAMADIGAGARSVVFGVLNSHALLTTGLEVAVSQDAYFANDIIGYRFVYRFDSNLTHDAHVKALVHAS